MGKGFGLRSEVSNCEVICECYPLVVFQVRVVPLQHWHFISKGKCVCCNSWKSENGWPDECADWVFHQNFMFMVFICVKSKVHVFGVPCLAEIVSEIQSLACVISGSECCEEFGNWTCWAIWSVKWYMQQLGWMRDARSRNCGRSYILSKKHDSNLGFPETMIQNWDRDTSAGLMPWSLHIYKMTTSLFHLGKQFKASLSLSLSLSNAFQIQLI
jgi:hypothetical protein